MGFGILYFFPSTVSGWTRLAVLNYGSVLASSEELVFKFLLGNNYGFTGNRKTSGRASLHTVSPLVHIAWLRCKIYPGSPDRYLGTVHRPYSAVTVPSTRQRVWLGSSIACVGGSIRHCS